MPRFFFINKYGKRKWCQWGSIPNILDLLATTFLLSYSIHMFLTIVISSYLFKVIKYYRKARDQRSKSVWLVLPPDTTPNNPTSVIRHLQSCHFLWLFLLCATEFQGAHLPCSHVNLGAFLKYHSTYLQDNEQIESCGVARLMPSSTFLKNDR